MPGKSHKILLKLSSHGAMVVTVENAGKEEVELSFEEALKRLEQIVEVMEEGDVALDDLVQKYEEGNRLLSICGKRLRAAELKIEQLKKTATGDTITSFDEADKT